jgi:hypothetical protein
MGRSRWFRALPGRTPPVTLPPTVAVPSRVDTHRVLITPLPGTNAQQLLRTLTQQYNDLQNLQGANAAEDLYNRYISWTSTSVRMLRSCLRAGDIWCSPAGTGHCRP